MVSMPALSLKPNSSSILEADLGSWQNFPICSFLRLFLSVFLTGFSCRVSLQASNLSLIFCIMNLLSRMQIYEYFFLQVEIKQRSEQREKSISNYRVQQLLGRNPLEAGKILYSLVSKNMLVSTNKGRWTSYSINAEYSQGVKVKE